MFNLSRVTEAPFIASVSAVAILGCVLFALYRWRFANQSREKKRLFYIACAIIVVLAALRPWDKTVAGWP
ncbi:MAG TPA: hypothetical protein VNG31_00855 [Candidatus Baltobacteraceae bacterium]|nr:hypothetical protein [Candidatus Baltobacteraceae bacterium]